MWVRVKIKIETKPSKNLFLLFLKWDKNYFEKKKKSIQPHFFELDFDLKLHFKIRKSETGKHR